MLLKRETDQSDILMMSPLHDLIGQSQHRPLQVTRDLQFIIYENKAVMNQWTVPLEWNGGMEYWNDLWHFKINCGPFVVACHA